MSVVYAAGNKPVKYPYRHDPDESKYYAFAWGAPTRLDSYEYLLDDVVVPATPNGFMYQCTKPGVSGATAPTYNTEIDGTTTDGTVTWTSVPYNLLLRNGDTFTSTWAADTGVTLDNAGSDEYQAWVRVTAVPDGATQFTLTNSVVVTRLDAKVEEYDRTMIVPISEL